MHIPYYAAYKHVYKKTILRSWSEDFAYWSLREWRISTYTCTEQSYIKEYLNDNMGTT